MCPNIACIVVKDTADAKYQGNLSIEFNKGKFVMIQVHYQMLWQCLVMIPFIPETQQLLLAWDLDTFLKNWKLFLNSQFATSTYLKGKEIYNISSREWNESETQTWSRAITFCSEIPSSLLSFNFFPLDAACLLSLLSKM